MPTEASAIHAQNDQFRKFITSLDYTADSYNKILRSASAEEMPLIADELQKINGEIKAGEERLKWKSDGVDDYIINIRNKVSDLETRLGKSKANLEKIQTIMATWADLPLFKRHEQKSTLLQLEDKETKMANRNKEIAEAGQKIHDLVKENMSLLNVADANGDIWKEYTVYVDNMIFEGFNKIIACSLNYFLRETDFVKNEIDPLFEAQLQLRPPELVYAPSMNYGDAGGFYEMIEANIGNVYHQGSLISRVAGHLEQKDYQADLEAKVDLADMKSDFMERVMNILTKASEFKYTFNKYAYLWVDDRHEFMKQFLLYNHVLTPEEIEAAGEAGVPESPPTLEQFKEQVDAYEAIYDEVSRLDDVCILDKWFRVDNKPFKASLLNIVKKWSYMFKQYLMEEITNSLKELDEFVKAKDKELVKEVPEGDYDRLTAMMGNLGAVRAKTEQFDGMFDPIKKKIELLKNYGQEVPDDVYTKLQQLPEKWTNTKKLALQAKQAVSPLQTSEVANIRRKTASFDVEQYSFREDFRKKAPFIYASEEPYKKLDLVSCLRLLRYYRVIHYYIFYFTFLILKKWLYLKVIIKKIN